MNPDNLNRVAMWGTITLLIIAGITFANRWASGNSDETSLAPTVVLSNAMEPPSTADWNAPGSSTSRFVPSPESTTTQPPESTVLDSTLETVVAGPTTTTDASTSTTTEPTTTTLLGTVSTTTAPPPEPTTPTSSTTTTAPTTTSSTTTTLPISTTTTTTPTTTTTTTTTVAAQPDIFLTRFSGRPEGDNDDWSVRLDVTLDGTVDGSYRGQVIVSWAGGTGSTVISTGSNGRGRATVGPFSAGSVTFSISGVQATGWTYAPGLNQVATTLWVFAPGD